MMGKTKHGSTVTPQDSRDAPSAVGRYPSSQVGFCADPKVVAPEESMGESSALPGTVVTAYREIDPL